LEDEYSSGLEHTDEILNVVFHESPLDVLKNNTGIGKSKIVIRKGLEIIGCVYQESTARVIDVEPFR